MTLNALLWAVARGVIPQNDVLNALMEANVGENEKAGETLADVLWVVSNQAERVRDDGTKKLVSLSTLKCVLALETLHEAGISSEPIEAIKKKVVRLNTRSLYTQNKFNLLKEESEGFSKVMCLVHSEITWENLQASKQNLLALIGLFDLDPNRVLDLVLDAYEMHYTNDCFMELLTKSMGLCTFLASELNIIRDTTLQLLARYLFYPHLSPKKEDIVASADQERLDMIQAAKSFGKVNLIAKKDEDDADSSKKPKTQDSNQVHGLIIEIGSTQQGFDLIEWFIARNVNPLQYRPLTLQVCRFIHELIDALAQNI
ncbi:THO complex subunit 2 [Aphanomyces cochlioides]|nr:THO complex subunit 2 [Aphanomyces cochlioides]KAG9400285.1 THO complex subunit 2 [Aphanomyces cochlioides]